MRQIAAISGGDFHSAATAEELRTVYAELGEQIGYETKEQDNSRPWLIAGTMLVLLGRRGVAGRDAADSLSCQTAPVSREHQYRLGLEWTGNQGSGTSNYRAFSRNHTVSAEHKPDILGSSDPAFRGDLSRWTPEDLLVAAVAQCHMLWYLHLCAVAGVVVTGYRDDPIGVMVEDDEAAGGGGRFVGITLRPTVTVRDPQMVLAGGGAAR